MPLPTSIALLNFSNILNGKSERENVESLVGLNWNSIKSAALSLAPAKRKEVAEKLQEIQGEFRKRADAQSVNQDTNILLPEKDERYEGEWEDIDFIANNLQKISDLIYYV